MSSPVMLRYLVIGFLSFVIIGTTWAQELEPKIVSKKLSDNFYVLYGGNGLGSNVGMSIGKDGILLVDAMKAETGKKLLQTIRTISDKPIRYVISTHSDSDHAGANAFFSKMGATTIGHTNFTYSDAFANLKTDQFALSFNGEDIVARPVIAHTFDDLIIYFAKSNVVFMGDTFTNRYHPTSYAGGYNGQMSAIDTALGFASENTLVVPGHGEVDTKSGLLKFKQDVSAWRAKMTQLQDLSVDEMVTDNDLNEIKDRFLKFRSPREIPETAFRRFIERTLAVDFVKSHDLSPDQAQCYTGFYRREDGREFEIIFEHNKFISREYGVSIYELMPLSVTEFHPRGSLSTRFVFSLGDGGQVDYLSISSTDTSIKAKPISAFSK